MSKHALTAVAVPADQPLSALTLGQLAQVANGAHEMAANTAADAIQHAIRAGAALAEAKAKLPHGEWLPWLEEHFVSTRRTASNYIRAFNNQDKLPSNEQRVSHLTPFRDFLKLLSGAEPHVSHNSGEVEWYTPPEYIEAARRVMGGIDLDPASCTKANETVKAKRFYSKDDDGLAKDWHGRVWMNPPYAAGVVDAFAAKLATEVRVKRVIAACVLVNNATETDWFRTIADVASAVCFPDKRVKFLDRDGNPVGAPLQGQALLYIGGDPDRFIDEMFGFGMCWVRPK